MFEVFYEIILEVVAWVVVELLGGIIKLIWRGILYIYVYVFGGDKKVLQRKVSTKSEKKKPRKN